MRVLINYCFLFFLQEVVNILDINFSNCILFFLLDYLFIWEFGDFDYLMKVSGSVSVIGVSISSYVSSKFIDFDFSYKKMSSSLLLW